MTPEELQSFRNFVREESADLMRESARLRQIADKLSRDVEEMKRRLELAEGGASFEESDATHCVAGREAFPR